MRISDWSSDVCSSDLLDLPIVRRALVAGTDIRYRDPQLQLVANINIDTVKARDTQFENDIRFSGSGTMRERPFTVSGGLLSPNATISGGKNQLALRAESAATILEVSGTLPGATEIRGADLPVEARGPNQIGRASGRDRECHQV